jgi:hypothetical protein
VIVVGRRAGRAAHLARAVRPLGPVQVAAHPDDAGDAAGLASAAASWRPDVVVQCASWHSPQEVAGQRSGWTDLLAKAGFGISLPLQAAPASLTAAALPSGSILVNGCFPDTANAVLSGLGLAVLCGIGNVSTLWAHLADPAVRLLAHHIHLHRPSRSADEAQAWLEDQAVPDVAGRLADLRALPRAALNERAGPPAALLIKHLITGDELRTSVPGPHGLPGGYPVVIGNEGLSLDLPAAVPHSAAVAWNQRMSELDGVIVHARGRVMFAPAAADILARYLPGLAAGFDLDQLPVAAHQMLQLRDRLRQAPARRLPPVAADAR